MDQSPPPPQRVSITRDMINDGSFMEAVRAIPGVDVPSDVQMENELVEFVATQPRLGPIYVFGYGSLIWNPAFEYEANHPVAIKGWHRRFCLWTPFARGTVDSPALTLALEPFGTVHGLAFRLPQGREIEELRLVWRREMFSGAYRPVWAWANSKLGRFPVATFVADRSKPSYSGKLTDIDVAHHVSRSYGPLGSGEEYLDEMIHHLSLNGISDYRLGRIKKLMKPEQRKLLDEQHGLRNLSAVE